MKVLLIDIDNKYPNLALMKLSAYHKLQYDTVFLNDYLCNPDIVYVSCVFTKNYHKINRLPFNNIIIGGTGTTSKAILSEEQEHIMPDYSLYNCNYALGFTTRGCIRNCKFCLVPEKEGKIRVNADIYEFWGKQKDLVLLDNNILALPEHFYKICSQIKKENIRVDFNQGLDIRLLTDDITKELSSLKHKEYHFAFDNLKDKDKILRGIELLKKYNIKRSIFYTLVGFDETFEQDLERLNILRELGQHAYCMRWNKIYYNKKYISLSQWVNNRAWFAKLTHEEYKEIRRCYVQHIPRPENDSLQLI